MNEEKMLKALEEVAKYMADKKLVGMDGTVGPGDGVLFKYQFVKLKKGIDYDDEEDEE